MDDIQKIMHRQVKLNNFPRGIIFDHNCELTGYQIEGRQLVDPPRYIYARMQNVDVLQNHAEYADLSTELSMDDEELLGFVSIYQQ